MKHYTAFLKICMDGEECQKKIENSPHGIDDFVAPAVSYHSPCVSNVYFANENVPHQSLTPQL